MKPKDNGPPAAYSTISEELICAGCWAGLCAEGREPGLVCPVPADELVGDECCTSCTDRWDGANWADSFGPEEEVTCD